MQVIPFVIGGVQPAMCLANVSVYKGLNLGGGVIYAILVYGEALASEETYPAPPAVWTPIIRNHNVFLL